MSLNRIALIAISFQLASLQTSEGHEDFFAFTLGVLLIIDAILTYMHRRLIEARRGLDE